MKAKILELLQNLFKDIEINNINAICDYLVKFPDILALKFYYATSIILF
jgi:hypothetical protein